MAGLLPSKFLCCSLQAGAIIVGAFGMMLALTFLILAIFGSIAYSNDKCNYYDTPTNCWSSDELLKWISNLFAFLAAWNALEIIMCIVLIVGASKGAIGYVTAWLTTTVCWIALHSAVALGFLCGSSKSEWVAGIAILGFFLLPIIILCVFAIMGYRKELNKPDLYPPNGIVPHMPAGPLPMPVTGPTTVVHIGGPQPTWYPQQAHVITQW